MARIPIRRPLLLQQNGNMHLQKPPIGDGANAFKAGDLVFITAGVLALVPNTGVAPTGQLVWGQTPDDSKLATDQPPVAFFGENHYCFSVEDATIEMNGTNGVGGVGDATVNNGNAGPQLSAFTLGASYGMKSDASSYSGVQMVNVSETTNVLLQLVGFAPNQVAADYNPRLLVKIPRAKLQG